MRDLPLASSPVTMRRMGSSVSLVLFIWPLGFRKSRDLMPDFAKGSRLNSTDQDWIARARALTAVLEAAAPRIEAACALPADVLDALHAAKMFRMLLPRSLGGAELDLATFFQVICAIAEGDASTAWCVVQNSGCSMAAAYLAPRAAQEVFADPRAALAWGFPAGPQCRAVPVDCGWRVSGTWNFGSGNRHSAWLGGHCQQADAGERTMLFPRSSAMVNDDSWDVIGLRGTGSDSYSVADLFVPAEHSVVARATGRDQQQAADARIEAEPERREQGMLYRLTVTNVYQSGFAAVGLGIARATLDAFIALATKKTPTGTNMPLRDSHWIQSRVALSEARLASARAWLLQILRDMWDECAALGRVGFEHRIQLRLASTYAIHEAREVVEASYVDAGATAIFAGNPFERRLRDMHAVSQQIQSSPAHFQSVGQHYLGLKPSVRFI
ncbi:MAG: acyl-CoA dehydrogenase family protein [Pseudomonadota bacterium]